MFKRISWLLLGLFAALSLGCGNSDRDKGKNSEMDRPKAATPNG